MRARGDVPMDIESILSSLELQCKRASKLKVHEAVFLIKNCLYIPKLLDKLRTTPTINYQNDLAKLYKLESILNVSFSELSWRQITLPTSSFLASICASREHSKKKFSMRLVKRISQRNYRNGNH
ncbi:hypothetical protein ACOME3_006260 [Neoechinorhynchus agilis]